MDPAQGGSSLILVLERHITEFNLAPQGTWLDGLFRGADRWLNIQDLKDAPRPGHSLTARVDEGC
jgi:hypothetical protein